MFVWSHNDMVGISPSIISHALNIDPKYPPKQQKRGPMDDERKMALKEEVDRLKENNFIRDAYYPEWISNPVLVPKPNGKWRTCIDYSNLKKSLSKRLLSAASDRPACGCDCKA